MRTTARLLMAVLAALILLPILQASAKANEDPASRVEVVVIPVAEAAPRLRRSDIIDMSCISRGALCCSLTCAGDWTESVSHTLIHSANAAAAREDTTPPLSGTGPSATAPPPKKAL